jgi:hypothetical protein
VSLDWMLFRSGLSGFTTPASAGDNLAVTVPASKRFKLISGVFSGSGGANTVTLKTGSTNRMSIAIPATALPVVLPPNPAGWFNGALDEDFNVGLSAASAVQCNFTYILMDS